MHAASDRLDQLRTVLQPSGRNQATAVNKDQFEPQDWPLGITVAFSGHDALDVCPGHKFPRPKVNTILVNLVYKFTSPL
ncbi:hypothetical protein [Ancylobacter pratisalsi]|uniref:Uncharacterized protein n=1 Tax=Ancylobacter pratisalsi TaxID=1745854 RepID=A0A6P1YIN7_9HYPH|nr:hypothetical protein [Ancylobacter pratisalsi]QIB32531.1 hypothetical protein G3A50_01565 [Ancylobacter pratisalsi]